MFNEPTKLQQRYAQQIEEGRKIEVITSTPEWQWYVDSVINPTIEDYTDRILTGKITSDKEDWVTRGMIMGMKMITDTTTSFKLTAEDARKKAATLQKELKDEL